MKQRTAGAYRFTISYPTSWWSVDLHPRVRDAEVRRRLLAGMTDGDRVEHADLIRDTVRSAKKWAAACYEQGALQFYGFFDVVEQVPLTAITMVLRHDVPDDVELDLSDLMIAFALRNAGLPLGKGTAANRTEIVDLAKAGPAGRSTSIEEIELEDLPPGRISVMNTLVPLPGTRELLIITSLTPNVQYTDQFLPLFERIADSLVLEKVTVDA
ncbi:hypothetical protein [Actinoplanes sp. M2I2]|uniref:hypothetical protein n=1 Tax=Actinoplanes sp. M2I2 TaxID=1734444 RepID=UPI0020211846|nr:hypothetical protein [Actinoplanes sp. M2I2]